MSPKECGHTIPSLAARGVYWVRREEARAGKAVRTRVVQAGRYRA
jgi:hypothetical protein